MRNGTNRWLALPLVVGIVLVLGFSVVALAKGPKNTYVPGDCCFKPADESCSECRGVWLCFPTNGCGCYCNPNADDYNCPWYYPECY